MVVSFNIQFYVLASQILTFLKSFIGLFVIFSKSLEFDLLVFSCRNLEFYYCGSFKKYISLKVYDINLWSVLLVFRMLFTRSSKEIFFLKMCYSNKRFKRGWMILNKYRLCLILRCSSCHHTHIAEGFYVIKLDHISFFFLLILIVEIIWLSTN